MNKLCFPSLDKLQFVAKEFGAEDYHIKTIGETAFFIMNTLNKGVKEEYSEYLYGQPYQDVEYALKAYRIDKSVFERNMLDYCKDIVQARENFKSGYPVEEWLAKMKCLERICGLFPDEIIFK